MSTPSGAALSLAALPQKLSSFPNHLVWINELVVLAEGATLKEVTSAQEYLKRKLVKNDDDEPLTTEGEEQLDKLKRVANTLNEAAMLIYVGQDVQAAQGQLERLRRTVASQVPPRLLEICEYLIDSLRCASAIMQSKGENLEGDSKEEYDRLCQKWKKLQGSDVVQAAIRFFKSRLCRQLGVKEDKTLEYCLEATQLDPECYLRYRGAYRSKRRIRRNIERGDGLKDPSPEEERLAAKAYQLRPNDLISITDYALVLKEKLWTKDRDLWGTPGNNEVYTKASKLFREAHQVAKNSGNLHWEVTVAGYLADFLAFGKKDKLKEQEGRHLFEELAENFSPNTTVLHKLGKIYTWGTGGNRDRPKAAACYEEALELCHTNFGCIMDYLKLLKSQRKFAEMVRVCDEALEHCKKDGDTEKLTAKRAEALAFRAGY